MQPLQSMPVLLAQVKVAALSPAPEACAQKAWQRGCSDNRAGATYAMPCAALVTLPSWVLQVLQSMPVLPAQTRAAAIGPAAEPAGEGDAPESKVAQLVVPAQAVLGPLQPAKLAAYKQFIEQVSAGLHRAQRSTDATLGLVCSCLKAHELCACACAWGVFSLTGWCILVEGVQVAAVNCSAGYTKLHYELGLHDSNIVQMQTGRF